MPTTFPPHRTPHAAVAAHVPNFTRPFFSRLIAFVLVTGIACPMLFLEPRRVEADSTTPIAAPMSLPPEGFIVHKAETRAVASVLPGAIESLISSLASPTLPAGFESAKLPTRTEQFIQSVLALITPTKSAIPNPNSQIPLPPPTGTVLFDFDEDGKADIGRWHPSNTEFKVRNSSDGSYSTHTIGSSSSVPAPGDFDGDGMTDAAVFNAGAWVIKKSSNGSTQNISFGTTGDVPVAADYDGDGITDAAVFRPSTNVWWVLKSSDSNYTQTSHGSSGDIPVTGNWDGDSYADLAVFRPSNGNWYVQRSTAGSLQVAWGLSTDVPIPADFDGDDKTDVAVYRPSTGAWWVMKSSTGFDGTYQTHNWGNYGDQPVPADYDDDGKADYAVWRPKTGVWYISKSSSSNTTYEYYGLGVAGDKAVPSAYIKQVATTVYGDDMAAARLSPKNATGGTNLYSQNFSWGTQLVGLPGRSGLDAGFGIGYNSLVWTKLGSDFHFDVDQSNVSPGFRLGFPTIEPAYYNDSTEKWNFLMITPSGGRVEFRQTAVSNVYETADSSYTQLKIKGAQSVTDPVEDIGIDVTTTDGTVMTYEWLGGAYRCSQIKDRNGNYITIDHDEDGTLRTVTDTLGRVITVNYDSLLYPTSITQTWKDSNGSGSNTTHTWATFAYTTKTVATNFGSVNIAGPSNDTVMKVLQKITYADASYTKFTHNGYIQVQKIENYAADDHLLNRVTTDLDSVSGAQSDCPRFTETRSYAENFNGGEDVIVHNEAPVSDGYSVGGLTGDAAKVVVHMEEHPDELYSQIYFGESGWKEGLPLATEDCTGDPESDCSTRKRWTWTGWTQDNSHPTDPSTLSYILNPRVVESRVGDGTNTKKSTVEYWVDEGTNIAVYGLVKSAFVYDTDLSTILKKTYTTYNLASEYTSRRIVGLPSLTEYYGRESSGLNLMSKVTYSYDEGNFSDSGLQQNISPTRHDGTNFGSSFIAGRGNLTSTTRWNVDYPTNSSYAVSSSVKYNTAGSVVARISPWNGTNTRTVKISYTDSFNSTVGVSTYAYPTTLTDPANNSSTVIYRYDTGANVEATSPAPAGNSYGKKTKRLYDSVGRLERYSVYINTTEHAYTRYEYPSNGIQSKAYSTIVDTDADGADADDEVLSETWSDGAGRVRLARTPHTFSSGSTATWAGTITEYDILGRVERQSVPTEVNSSWAATGDDATRGFLWTYQEYDWMNRVTRKVNTDGDPEQSNASDVIIGYSTCGCAGGLVTTIQGEEIIEKDWSGSNPTSMGRRTQKIYQDILGRSFKTEVMKWNGTDVYLRTETAFNGRDQAIEVDQADLDNPSSPTVQTTTMGYDGHGRMISRHIPQQDAETETAYAYNPDDTIASMTDARGASTHYAYNSRGLVEEIDWSVPSGEPQIDDTTTVTFAFDNLGNRTEITDGLGTVDYEYDSLSRMTAETRDFTDTLSSAPTGGVFRLEYTYTIGGQLKSLEDPYGDTINYSHDKVGRLSAVTGSSFAGVTSYASSPHYRAWGGLQSLSYSNNTVMSMTFDDRLRANHSQLVKNGTTTLMSKDYGFYADGALRKTDDLVDDKFDRVTTYDNMARPKTATSGLVARGGTPTTEQWYDVPYVQTYSFNAFGNLTVQDNKHWGLYDFDFTHVYENNRLLTGSSIEYDADGRQTENSNENLTTTYDAAGRPILFHKYIPVADESEIKRHYDGDGREAKREERNYVETEPEEWEWVNEPNKYYIRSSILGGEVVSQTGGAGEKQRTFVQAAGAEIAWQNKTGTSEEVIFQNWDAAGMSYMTANSSGSTFTNYGSEGAPAELGPMGGNVGTENPIQQIPGETCVGCGAIGWEDPLSFLQGQPPCELNGMTIGCQSLNNMRELVGGMYEWREWNNSIPQQHYVSSFTLFDRLWLPIGLGRNKMDERFVNDWEPIRTGQGQTVESWRQYFTETEGTVPGIKALHFKDADSVKGFLGSVLNSGVCKSQLAKLIDEFAKASGVKAITNDLEGLFKEIISQDFGGVEVNISQQLYLDDVMVRRLSEDWGDGLFAYTGPPRPAFGLTQRVFSVPTRVGGRVIDFNGEAYILVQETVFNPSIRGTDYSAANKAAHVLIHELLHAAATRGTYQHDTNETGLQTAVRRLGHSSVADFLNKYCNVPKGTQSRRRGRSG